MSDFKKSDDILLPHEELKVLLNTLEAETIPIHGHADPKAVSDCWRYAHELIGGMLNECSHLAANICPYSYGDEHGHQRCSEIDKLRNKAKKYDELIAIMDKFYATDESGELFDEDNGGLLAIGEAVAYKLGYL